MQVLCGVGAWTQVSCMLGKHYTNGTTSPTHLIFIYCFEIGSMFCRLELLVSSDPFVSAFDTAGALGMCHWALRVNSHLYQEHYFFTYSRSLWIQWGFSWLDSPQTGNPGQTKVTSLLKYSLVNQWVFIGILQKQGQFRGSCDTGSNTPGWVKTPESCSWGALRRTSRQQDMDYVG